ncbi:CTP synthetase [Thalassococcus sp. CAU 1522]|uniref:CTP synthetase n=1 Tax=Thalassococcus arenae TaxID=2851652 RepID=A0ABS6N399_9RHOB|nr:CTP synthetase [Thalassococcus arenae]MBV2358497.1 CTP synthetase [Thalassococcus arenae]
MLPLTLVIHIFLGSTLAGCAVIAALVMGYDTATAILVAASVGFFSAFPVSWLIAKRLV